MGRRPKDAPKLDDLLSIVVAEYQSGMSLREIAAPPERKISTATVNDLLIRAGVPKRSTGEGTRLRDQRGRTLRRDIPEDELRRLYLEELWSVIRISKHFGVSGDAISDRLKRYDIKRTPEQERMAKQIVDDLRKATNTELFGGVSANYDPDVRARTAATNLERYGAANPFASEQGKAKLRATLLSRYGVENPAQLPATVTKRRATSRERYGADHHLQAKWDEYTMEVLSSRESFVSFLDSVGLDNAIKIAQVLGVDATTIHLRLHQFDLWHRIDKSNHTSAFEIEVGEALTAMGISWVKNVGILGGRKEMDHYSPTHKIGIESNGTWWHSEVFRERKYHINKSLAATERDIFLYHVFEYEWRDERKRALMLSQIANLFGLNTRRIAARKCQVREIDTATKNAFLNANHLQGGDKPVVKLGLYFGEELVSVMTFSDNPRNKAYEWELSRFASLINTNVIGAAGKLFKHFVRNYQPTSVLSYSDIAKTRGSLYETLGFTLSHVSQPGYVWTNGPKIFSRYQTQMEGESRTMTERGYVRIYDCGNKVWGWHA